MNVSYYDSELNNNNLLWYLIYFFNKKGYTASQMREIREGFNTLDRDRSGKLSIGEIKFFLKATNVADNEQEIKRIVKEMDIDQDGEISK